MTEPGDMVEQWLAECTDGRVSSHTITMLQSYTRWLFAEEGGRSAALAASGADRMREADDLLTWLAGTMLELKYEGWEDDVWQVYQVTGGRSDREWSRIAEGATPLLALRLARQALGEPQ